MLFRITGSREFLDELTIFLRAVPVLLLCDNALFFCLQTSCWISENATPEGSDLREKANGRVRTDDLSLTKRVLYR